MADNSLSVKVEVDSKRLQKVVRALKKESDGSELARDLTQKLRKVAEPALGAVRAAILSMDSHSESVPGLRASIARATKISVRSTGKRPGLSIYTTKTGMPRGFEKAPKHTNSVKGWRHRVFGTDKWVAQIGKPGWFDATLKPFREPAVQAADEALKAAERRVSERSE